MYCSLLKSKMYFYIRTQGHNAIGKEAEEMGLGLGLNNNRSHTIYIFPNVNMQQVQYCRPTVPAFIALYFEPPYPLHMILYDNNRAAKSP